MNRIVRPLDHEAVRAALVGLWTRVDIVERTGSTNADLLAAAAAGAPDRAVLVAEHQEAGRGRLARSWVSPPGSGLTVSVLVRPEGVSGDFSFIVIGDTGEGDASQHVLRDQLIAVAGRPEVRFVVISSDVVYPNGAMIDYEAKFWLPCKGVRKRVKAIQGKND